MCSFCTMSVEKALKRLPGVKSVQVNLVHGIILVDADRNKVSEAEVAQKVEDLGYTVVATEAQQYKTDEALSTLSLMRLKLDSAESEDAESLTETIIPARKIHCEVCSRKIVKTLAPLPGVRKVVPDVTRKEVLVAFEPSRSAKNNCAVNSRNSDFVNSVRVNRTVFEIGFNKFQSVDYLELL